MTATTPTALAPADLAARTDRVVDAAVTLGREHGLTVDAPRVLHDLFSVVVHLDPAPVVVRAPTVLPAARRADPSRSLAERRREIAVARALDAAGFPTTRPSPLLPAEPLVRDGFVLTAWEYVEVVADAEVDDPAGFVADLHAAFRATDLDLPFFALWDDWFTDALDALAGLPHLLAPDDLALARAEHARLDEVLGSPEAFTAAFPHVDLQPVHGDAPLFNLIVTPAGPVVSDLEHACLGPVEWDLTLAGPDLRGDYDAATVLRGGRPLDRDLLALLDRARWLQIVCCLGFAPDAPPILAEGIVPLVETWKGTLP